MVFKFHIYLYMNLIITNKRQEKQVMAEKTIQEKGTAEENKAVEELKEDTLIVSEDTETSEAELSPWYYFFSQGCGWCKKASPVVEELNKDGHDVLMLDLAEPDNQKLRDELFEEYGTRCGTPWFICYN